MYNLVDLKKVVENWVESDGLRGSARRHDIPISTIRTFLSDRSPNLDTLEKIAKAANWASLTLQFQEENDDLKPEEIPNKVIRPAGWKIFENTGKVQLYGYAGAGGEVAYDGELHHGEVAPAPPGNKKNLAAVEVRGDSAAPYLREGDIIYFYPDYPANPSQHIGRLVLATSVDGAAYIKILRRGDTKGFWNLESINPRHPMMEDMELQRISPFVWIHYNGDDKPFQKF